MKPAMSALLAIRPMRTSAAVLAASIPVRCAARQHRSHATQIDANSCETSRSKRHTVTPFNDDGRIPWSELSKGGKTARAAQQTFNFGLIMTGMVLTGAVGYFMWTDVFAPDSKINQFNRAVDRIKKDPRCIEVLGEPKKMIAHGEQTANKWRRSRPVASTEKTDQQGNQHLVMHFHVDGPLQNGIAQLHMVRRQGEPDYEYRYFFLDVKGHDRIYLEKAEPPQNPAKRQISLFGVKW